ncbi:MAG: HEAT repeat domain-containing protein [Planctomycetia bacterium]|nr:HEAT repeat domain-containing protein [Planctomycetia bacterium]
MRVSKHLLFAIPAVLFLGLGTWFLAPTLHSWYLLRGLRNADAETRGSWANAVARLGNNAVDPLLDGLSAPNGDNAVAGLDAMLEHLPAGQLASRITRAYSKLSPEGRIRVLHLLSNWVERSTDQDLHQHAAELLAQLDGDAPSLEVAVGLASAVMSQPRSAEVVVRARKLAQAGLASRSPAVRVRAVSLCLQPGLDLLEPVAALLTDIAPEVRRAALIAVGPATTAVSEEALLPCLHDEDFQVRELARSSLLARGLRSEQVELGRLITHPRSRIRLEVLDRLPEVPELDPVVWLRRLSQDGSPAVRAAAARAMGQLPQLDLSDRLEQMARTDPSPTVAQLARYYLIQRNRLRTVGAP